MLQTLAEVCITWDFFHTSLYPHEVVAALILIAAVAMVLQVQEQIKRRNNQSTRSCSSAPETIVSRFEPPADGLEVRSSHRQPRGRGSAEHLIGFRSPCQYHGPIAAPVRTPAAPAEIAA